jgi:hypothetical protein
VVEVVLPMSAMSAILCIFPLTLLPSYLNILGVRQLGHYRLSCGGKRAMDLKS